MKTPEKVLLTAELNAGLNIQLSHEVEIVTRKIYGWKPKTKIVNRYVVKWQPTDAPGWSTVGEFSTLNKAFTQFRKMQKVAVKEKLNFIHNDNQRRGEGLHSPQSEGNQGLLW